jgi:hypothetical protein
MAISITAILVAISIDWTAECCFYQRSAGAGFGGVWADGGNCGEREEEEALELHLGRIVCIRIDEYESGFV